ncbi:MAG: proton-conducting transporter membrane subunit [Bryobacteraceae bacterium]
MPNLWIVAAVAIPIRAATVAAGRKNGRTIAVLAATISLACLVASTLSGAANISWLRLDDVAALPAFLFAAVMLAAFTTAPERDAGGSTCAALLTALSGTLIIYTAEAMAIVFVGWILSMAPLFKRSTGSNRHRVYERPVVMLLLSAGLLGVAAALLTFGEVGVVAPWAFGLAVTAALIRSGIFPFHSWMITAFEEEKMLSVISLASAQAGAFLIVRLAAPGFAEPARFVLPFLSALALFSTVLMAFMALGEIVPRRILGLVIVSQSGFIISGLELSNIQGITGALVHWLAVSASTAGLLIVLRALEVRYGWLGGEPFLGLGTRAPRFAVLFLLFALALVGLPGTLGFCGEDLLFHGAIESHPVLGLALPLATAISAVQLFRLFSRLFLGKRGIHVPAIADCLPRERWALTALALFLLAGGFAPYFVIQSRIGPARSIADVLVGKTVARLK